MTVREIESPHNPLVKKLASLSSPKGRRERRLFLAEGPRVLSAAREAKAEAELLLLDASRFDSPPPASPRSRDVVLLSPRAFARFSAVEHSQGLAAAFPLPELPAPSVPPEGRYFALAACGVQDPGNMGALMRVAAACGCDALIGVEPCADFFSPKTVRASAGAVFSLPLYRLAPAAFLSFLDAAALETVAADAAAGAPYTDFEFPPRLVLLLGSEGRGLPAALLERSRRVCIPMERGCESLNVAVAAGVLAFRAREKSSGSV